jgi:hypothetical protein
MKTIHLIPFIVKPIWSDFTVMTLFMLPAWLTLFKMHVYILVNKRSDTKIFLKYIFMLKPKQLFIIIKGQELQDG